MTLSPFFPDLKRYLHVCFSSVLENYSRNPKIEVWKTVFLFNWVIFRTIFVHFPGCMNHDWWIFHFYTVVLRGHQPNGIANNLSIQMPSPKYINPRPRYQQQVWWAHNNSLTTHHSKNNIFQILHFWSPSILQPNPDNCNNKTLPWTPPSCGPRALRSQTPGSTPWKKWWFKVKRFNL